jgi:DNA polymerase-3 subunit alpha
MQNLDKSNYIHLRCHSEFSITDGIVKIEDYVKQAVEKNMPAAAITDLSNLFGAVKFYKKATKAGVKDRKSVV